MSHPFSHPSTPVLQIAKGIATITLNRPAQRNRLESDDLKALLQHFDQIHQDQSIRVLVLTANTLGQPKPVFCAGYDIGAFDEHGQGATSFEKVPEALAVLRPVTLCALNGSVYGGATDMVLACDLRIGLQGIEWRMPATAIGLHYYPSGLQRYVQRMGLAATQRAFLTARPFTWKQLDKLGLFEDFVEADQWQALLDELTQDILTLAPSATEATKQSISEIAMGIATEASLQARVERSSRSDEFAEGRAAFVEKRNPVF